MYEHTGGLAVVGSPPAQSVNVHNSNRGRSSPISQSPKLGNRFSPTCAENARSLQQGLPRARPLLFNNGLTDQDSVKREPFVIGVAGGTASGKTTVCNQIMQSLHDQRVAMISMDSFYRGLTEYEKANVSEYNFDHPNSFDAQEIAKCLVALKTGGDVEVPEYCFVTHQRLSQSRRVNSSDVVIIEGILLFQFDEIVEHLNMKIFVDTDDDVRLARRIQRDTLERGRDVKGVIDQYTKFVKPMFEQFVLPSKKAADIIIPWARGDNVVAIDLIVQHIQTKLGQHDLRRIYSNLDVLPGNYQTRGMHTTIRNRNASKSDFVFYSNRLIRLVVEHGLGQLPFTEKVVTTPTDGVYVGVGFCEGLCGVSIIRSGEAMENALRDCCKGIKIGKILIHRPNKSFPDRVGSHARRVDGEGSSRVRRNTCGDGNMNQRQAEEPLPKLDSFGMADEVSDATASLSISQSPALPACENVNSPVPTGAYSLGRVGPSSVGTPGGMRSETKRRERTDERSIIYEKLPTDIAKRHVLLLDPILATGNSAKEAINILLNRGVAQSSIILCTLIAAPQGIHAVCSTFPEIRVITSEIDQGLDLQSRVIPGIGEFGDRYFGTD